MRRPTATLCAIMKDEGAYIAEWVAFHRSIGFDRIIIYDNDSTDSSDETLRRLDTAGLIDYIPWPSKPGVAPQRAAYADAISFAATDWICFLDADEFLNLKEHTSVSRFLEMFPQDVGAVAINWRLFGSSGLINKSPAPVLDRFQMSGAQEHHINRHVKTIARITSIDEMHVHACSLKAGRYVNETGQDIEIERMGFSPFVSTNIVQINHYVVKSRQEFEEKKARGNANRPLESTDKFTRIQNDYFEHHDHSSVLDRTIHRGGGEPRSKWCELVNSYLK
jgi:glycosyltransferase involved in cell wall biosynthesis